MEILAFVSGLSESSDKYRHRTPIMTDSRLAELMAAITHLQVKTPVDHPASRVLRDFFETCHEFRKVLSEHSEITVRHEEELAQALIKEREECVKLVVSSPSVVIAASRIKKRGGQSG
jgi:hypothetical protein